MKPALILHGGAGSWRVSEERIKKGLKDIREALMRGWKILVEGGSSIDSVVEALKYMEDSGSFNAGLGSCLNIVGDREMDAGIMDGERFLVGAVANVKYPKNPIELAKFVMEKTNHVILGGEGADLLARKIGLERIPEPPEYIMERYYKVKKEMKKYLGDRFKQNIEIFRLLEIGDTIGGVAIDLNGKIAAAVSTGGIWLKLPGRIGDSPIPGAGFYTTRRFGVAATGYGETIIETMPGIKISYLITYGYTLENALDIVFQELNDRGIKESMGLIGIDSDGKIVYKFDTRRMMIAYKNPVEEKVELLEKDST